MSFKHTANFLYDLRPTSKRPTRQTNERPCHDKFDHSSTGHRPIRPISCWSKKTDFYTRYENNLLLHWAETRLVTNTQKEKEREPDRYKHTTNLTISMDISMDIHIHGKPDPSHVGQNIC